MNRINKVAVQFLDRKTYPEQVPFNPPERYPEYAGTSLDETNTVYAGVRDMLYRLELDRENYGSSEWNPFKDAIQPGMTVFIKPNTVAHVHGEKNDINSVIVHASVLRPILDYVCIALKNEGRIIIGDSQLIMSLFDEAMKASGIKSLLAWYRQQTHVSIECFDLRIVRTARSWLYGKWRKVSVENDPRGYRTVDLGDRSCFKGIDPSRLRIAVASYKQMYKYHSNGKHQYIIPQSFLESDVVINISKFKTHRRTAVTLALKNFMGIPALKDSLPHFITGSVSEGGDQYINPSIRKKIGTKLHDQIQSNPFMVVKFVCALVKYLMWHSQKVVPFKDNISEAMWHGNDTLWRTLLDLNRIVLYSSKDGAMQEVPQRKIFCVIDGIIAGEKNGPLAPDPVSAGVLIAGFSPVTVDVVGASLMGFDIDKIPLIRKALEANHGLLPLYEGDRHTIEIIEHEGSYDLERYKKLRNLAFEAHPAWKGHVELPRD
jgi:uncharacterized protein (DUF362 family)